MKNAEWIRRELCEGIDFSLDDEKILMKWLNENNKKSILSFFEFFPDETKHVFSGLLERGWLNFADNLYKIIKDRVDWERDESCNKSAMQSVLKSLRNGDIDTALSLQKSYLKRYSIWYELDVAEAANEGFYNCLISGNLEDAQKFWKKFNEFMDLTDTLKNAYNYCIAKYLSDTASGILDKFELKADFSQF